MPLNPKDHVAKPMPALIISLLFVTPFMVSDEIYNGVVMAKEFWFFGVVALMLLYSSVLIILKKDQLKIELNIIDILLLAFYTWCFIRAIFTPYTPFWHNHKLQILSEMMVVYFFVKSSIKGSSLIERTSFRKNDGRRPNDVQQMTAAPSPILNIILFSFILSGFLQAIYGLLQLYGVYHSYHNLFKVTGSFFNPAPYAMYLAVVFPVALGKTLFNEKNEGNEGNEENEGNENNEENKVRNYSFIFSFFHSFITHTYSFIHSIFHFLIKNLPLATVIAILLILPATMNRASWLGALVGSLVVLQYKYNWLGKIKQVFNTKAKKVLALTFTLLIVAGMGIGLFYMKAGSSNGRLFIWEVTLRKIAEKPLFGYGLGRFEAEYNNWQAEYFMKHPEEMDGPKGWVAGNTKYAFNDYIEIGSELGILGICMLLILIIFLLINTTKIYNQKIVLCLAPIGSLLAIMSISSPFYNVPILAIFITVLGCSSGFCMNNYLFVKSFRLIAMAVMTLALLLLFKINISNYHIYKIVQLANISYAVGDNKSSIKEYKKIYPFIQHNASFLQMYGKSLAMHKEYQKAKKILLRSCNLGGDYILYTSLGNVNKELKLYPISEKNYQHAAYMEPNKIYPHYLMAKLYESYGNRSKAVEKAKMVINMNPKINNKAIEEIKAEMKIILKKNK